MLLCRYDHSWRVGFFVHKFMVVLYTRTPAGSGHFLFIELYFIRLDHGQPKSKLFIYTLVMGVQTLSTAAFETGRSIFSFSFLPSSSNGNDQPCPGCLKDVSLLRKWYQRVNAHKLILRYQGRCTLVDLINMECFRVMPLILARRCSLAILGRAVATR